MLIGVVSSTNLPTGAGKSVLICGDFLVLIVYRSFYTLIIWSFAQYIAILLFVPETYHPVLLRNKARKLRKETGDDRWHAPIEKMNRSIAQVRRTCTPSSTGY